MSTRKTTRRERIAAQIYSDHYIRPSKRAGWKYYVSPKQCFRAADFFLQEAERQRGVGNSAVCDFDSFGARTKPAVAGKECEHVWTYPHPAREIRCVKCNEPKVAERVPREVWVKLKPDGTPWYAFEEKPKMTEYDCQAGWTLVKFREILD